MNKSKSLVMKFIVCFCLVCGIVNMNVLPTEAKTLKSASDFEYWENEDGKTITIVNAMENTPEQRSLITKIVIPAKIDGKKVTAIGSRAFADCENLNTVVIEKGIKSIGNDAFDNCYKLTSITIPSSVKKIPVPSSSGVGMLLNQCSKDLVVITAQGSYAQKYFNKYSLYLGKSEGDYVNGQWVTTKKSEYKKAKVVAVAGVKKFKAVGKQTAIALTWKKVKNMSGYQIQYSKDKQFSNAITKTVKKTKYTLKKLESGTKYYVRIRAYKNYKNAKGKTVKAYGEWTTLNTTTK